MTRRVFFRGIIVLANPAMLGESIVGRPKSDRTTYSKELDQRINTRGPKNGPCNICGLVGGLTEDHVPPKGLPGVGQHELYRLHQTFGVDPVGQGRHFQRGVTYRTLCHKCNSVLLGGSYDPALIELAKTVVAELRRGTYATQELQVRFRPNLVARAAAGHLLAIGVESPAAGVAETAMCDFFRDTARPLPSHLEFHVWVYPSNRRVMIRGAVRQGLLGEGGLLHFFLLKFFPLALMFTFDSSLELPSAVRSLAAARGLRLGDEMDLVLPVRGVPLTSWPEFPTDDDSAICLHGEQSAVAFPRRQR